MLINVFLFDTTIKNNNKMTANVLNNNIITAIFFLLIGFILQY